jgi:hypothetical protein
MRLLPPAIDTLQAAYSLEMEHPSSGHRAVETFAAMPAVVARAAELIQAGYTIGIWSPATFEAQLEARCEGRVNMGEGMGCVAAEAEAQHVWFSLLAADLCAALLANGGIHGRFAMSVDELAEAAGRSHAEVEAAVAWAVEQAWLRRDIDDVVLRAAGIHVAKQTLELPRQVS